MFTGLIEEMAEAVSLRRLPGGAVLTIRAGEAAEGAAVGDSIAVNGACLTVTGLTATGMKGKDLSFDLSEETLRSTTLGGLRPGERVNVERSLRADGRLGGHFVTGHVDGVGKIRSKARIGDTFKVEIGAPSGVMGLLVGKGSVAVDGISLTVVDVLRESFTVFVIPHTAEVTTIGARQPGDAVNLEADIIGKYVMRFMGGRQKDESLAVALKRGGYI
jgi:riboflavin synthase